MSTNSAQSISLGDILVVDDNTLNLKLLLGILTKAGYRVRPASSGELALRSVRAKPPELILLDIKMPGLDGIEVCRRLKADPGTRGIPVIFLSALMDSESKVEALESGGIDYVTKPIEHSEVLARINIHLKMYRMQQKLVQEIEGRRQVEAKYSALIENIPAITYLASLDETSSTLFVSPQLESMLGYPSTMPEQDPDFWFKKIHPDDQRRVSEELAESHETRKPFVSEYRMIAQDGRVVWMRDEALIVYSESEEPLYMQGVMLDITERRQAEAERARLFSENRSLIREMMRLQEVERSLLARELHDELSQQLTAIKAFAASIAATGGKELAQVHDSAQAIGASASHIYEVSHQMINRLRPDLLDIVGLVGTIQKYLEEWQRTHPATRVTLRETGKLPNLGNDQNITLFRVIQECLTNVAKHADATSVRVFLGMHFPAKKTKNQPAMLRLVVRDNGRGLDTSEQTGGFGLLSMRERVETIHGRFLAEGCLGKGTRILVEFPLGRKEGE